MTTASSTPNEFGGRSSREPACRDRALLGTEPPALEPPVPPASPMSDADPPRQRVLRGLEHRGRPGARRSRGRSDAGGSPAPSSRLAEIPTDAAPPNAALPTTAASSVSAPRPLLPLQPTVLVPGVGRSGATSFGPRIRRLSRSGPRRSGHRWTVRRSRHRGHRDFYFLDEALRAGPGVSDTPDATDAALTGRLGLRRAPPSAATSRSCRSA